MLGAPLFSQRGLVLTLAGLLAVALQIQVTILTSESYMGLRVNLADFMLPFMGLGIAASLLLKRSVWPQWIAPFGLWVPVLLSLVIGAALLNGWHIHGEISRWALVNKTIGWGIVMAYMMAGAWVASNTCSDVFRVFTLALVGFFCGVMGVELGIHFIFHEIGSALVPRPPEYLQGLMYNRNAYAFLFVVCAVLISELACKSRDRASLYVLIVFWALVPFGLVMNGSRALWLVMALIVPVLVFRHALSFLKFCLPALVIGGVLGFVLFQNASDRALRPLHQTQTLMAEDVAEHAKTHNVSDYQDAPRVRVLREGLALYRDHPVTGGGLGRLVEAQIDQGQEFVSAMDTSLLWVLFEMGPVGLFCFVFVYLVLLGCTFERRQEQPVYAACFMMLLGFGVFSLFHEILYSRHMWFILGMGVVMPIARQKRLNP